MKTKLKSVESRMYPFTIRISFQERLLLMAAARKRETDQAKIARLGLDPLFSRLADEFCEVLSEKPAELIS